MSKQWGIKLVGVCCAAQVACAGSNPPPLIHTFPEFQEQLLERPTILILPLAVSNELGDERTGIVLDDETRLAAARAVCEHARELRDDMKVVCFDAAGLAAARPKIDEAVLIAATADAEMPQQLLLDLSEASGTRFVIFFRPEDASGSVKHALGLPSSHLASYQGASAVLDVGLGQANGVIARGYTISALLIDLRTGEVLRAGAHAGVALAASRSDPLLGYVEPPPALPLLARIMNELVEGLVDD